MEINSYPGNLKSKRLTYRPLLLDDAKAWSIFFDDPKATQYFPKKMQGNGYASEAANFFRTYAQEQFPEKRIISIIHPQNQSSKNVALRNDMKHWENIIWHGMDVEIYST